MKATLELQYQLTREARAVLLGYCATITQEDFVRSHPGVGNGGSIRNLLVHINNSYHGWLQHIALQQPYQKMAYDALTTLKDCEGYFRSTDKLMQEFLTHFEGGYETMIEGQLTTRSFRGSPLQMFTHVVTHEFHHKGQILALSRIWGYEPPDTDILR